MSTTQFILAIINWLQADPSHIVVAASSLAAITPTPSPNTVAGKLYKILEIFALNFLHAKDNGVKITKE
jgi:hypothetical protein